MRIFYFSDLITVLLFFVIWPLIQVGGAIISLYIPDKYYKYDKFPYKSYGFELNGEIYQKLFLVKKWKHLLPDGAKAWKKKGYQKKHINDFQNSNLEKFLVESCRAELTHIIPIFSVWVFFLFTDFYVGLIMLFYSLVTNLPCLIVQRYNRPRILKIINIRKKNK